MTVDNSTLKFQYAYKVIRGDNKFIFNKFIIYLILLIIKNSYFKLNFEFKNRFYYNILRKSKLRVFGI